MDTKPDAVSTPEWAQDLIEKWGEHAFHWLLEQEPVEQEEKLFAVARDGLEHSGGLSEAEVRLANRHMLGGAVSDDLADFIEEEIVLTSVGDSSDIYTDNRRRQDAPAADPSRHNFIAVQHNRRYSDHVLPGSFTHLEGVDVLGLGPPLHAPVSAPLPDTEPVMATGIPVPEADIADSDTPAGQPPRPEPYQEVETTPAMAFHIPSPEITESTPSPAAIISEPEPEPVPVPELVAVQADGADTWSWCVPRDITFNFSTRSSAELFPEFLDAFIEEAGMELEKLEDAIGGWERDAGSDKLPQTVLRVLHTLKGIAKGVGLQRYGTFIHNFETLLGALPAPGDGAGQEFFRIVNAWLDTAVRGYDHIQSRRADVASELPRQTDSPAPAATGLAGTVTQVTGAVRTASASPQLQPLTDGDREQDRQIADAGAKALGAQQSIRISADALDYLLNLANEVQKLGVRASQSTLNSKRAAGELLSRLGSLRTHIARISDRALLSVTSQGRRPENNLDALEMDQYTDIHEAASILREAVDDLDELARLSSRHTSAAEALLKQQAAVVSSLGSSIRASRVVPVSRLMPGLRRIVRTVSSELGKAVTFRVLSEAGKLDRDSHACCQIILEHMVRNALDHGLELPGERVALGKPDTGVITIDVRKQGPDYLLVLSDDGRGIDPQKMREQARRKGLDVDIESLGDRDAQRLIFHRGFSTSAAVSEISGRGVGMDIVMGELQRIGGDIEIDSQVGRGTSFRIRIPSNISVNGALLVTASETPYAIPFDGLIGVEHVAVDDFYHAVEQQTLLPLLGRSCTPSYLATLCFDAPLPERSVWGPTVPVIVAGSGGRHMAIAVDRVEQALELVIRSLGSQFAGIPWVAGGTTSADGRAIVALNLNLLVANQPASGLPSLTLEPVQDAELLVMVVDDSRTQRMVATTQLHTLGVTTITAENGQVAMDLLGTLKQLPDIILLDIEMPIKDGIQTLREIRRSELLRHIPVIMITSRTGHKHRELASQEGCSGYMGKPFNFPLLVEQIAELTGRPLQVS